MPDVKGTRVLVTGAGGFIGSHLVEHLAAQGHEVVGLLKRGENPRWVKDLPVQLVEGDLLDRDSLARAAAGVSIVFHLASRMGGWSDAAAMFETNLQGTRNLVDAFSAVGAGQRRFLFASSFAAVGGTSGSTVYDESIPPRPAFDYGKSKLQVEEFLATQALPFTVVRLPLVYGPRSLRGLFPIFKISAKGVRLLLPKVYSNVGYVTDIARGMAEAAACPLAAGRTYFLGGDRIFDTREICGAIAAAVHPRPLPVPLPYGLLYATAFALELHARAKRKSPLVWRRNLTEYMRTDYRFSIRKAGADFGFVCRVPLADGIRLTAEWYRRHGYL